MASWTAPTTRSSGDLITASNWNTDLTENLKYLKDSPTLDGGLTVGSNASVHTITVTGTSSGTGGGAQVTVKNNTTDVLNLGNESNILGTAYSDAGYVYGGTGLKLGTGGNTRVTIDSAGVVTLNTGQLAFPASQNASSGANTLDDYEEGTYTPTWTSAGTAPALGNGTITGQYVKVGQIVWASVVLTAGSTTTFGNNANAWTFSLPFTAGASTPVYAIGSCDDTGTKGYGSYVFLAAGGTTVTLTPMPDTTNGSVCSTTPFTWGNTDTLRFTITYRASA